ncbi:hypothetical protein [Streptomyces smaragdinus]|uniref:hypothetical protein n=1 Tax=Streptomyces smaragdinus TaxID=2585196 RepID=UPI0018869E16|nr:hypothetical protein [Streptomyces smaragdinus]
MGPIDAGYGAGIATEQGAVDEHRIGMRLITDFGLRRGGGEVQPHQHHKDGDDGCTEPSFHQFLFPVQRAGDLTGSLGPTHVEQHSRTKKPKGYISPRQSPQILPAAGQDSERVASGAGDALSLNRQRVSLLIARIRQT